MGNETKLFLSFLFLYVIFAQSLTWGEYSKMDLYMAIADENRFQIDTYANNTGDRSFYDGHYYSDKAPGVAFLAEPAYMVIKSVFFVFGVGYPPAQVEYTASKVMPGTGSFTMVYDPLNPGPLFLSSLLAAIVMTASIPAAATVLLVYKTGGFLLKNTGQKMLIAVAYGAGTLAFSYGSMFFTHSMAALLSFASFCILFGEKQHKRQISASKMLLAGLFAGLAVVMDYPAALILVMLFVYTLTFRNLKLSVAFAAAAATLGVVPLLLYNATILGNPLQTVYTFTDPNIRTDVGPGMGFSHAPNLFIMFRHTLDPYRGLFFYSPILLLAVVGMYWMFREHGVEAMLTLAIFTGMLIAFSMRGVNFFDFGTALGARNYILALPFLMMPLSFALKNVNFRIFSTLLIASVAITAITLQDWEWMVGESNTVYIAEPYRSMVNSFEAMPNPLKDHYFPLFLKNGPRARLVENVLSGRSLLEIRHAHSSGNEWPFLTMVPIVAVLALVWRNDLSYGRIMNVLKRNPELIFVPAIMFLLLI